MPPFNFKNSYKKPEELLPQDIAEVKAHPEMVGFDENAMRKKIEEQNPFEFDETTVLGQMERMILEDKIKWELEEARYENASFMRDFEKAVANHYKEVGLRPEKSFQEQFQLAYKKVNEEALHAEKLVRKIEANMYPFVEVTDRMSGFRCFIVYNEGVLLRIAVSYKRPVIDLNKYGFPGVVDRSKSAIVLNNNAGEISIKDSPHKQEGYCVDFMKETTYKSCTVTKLTMREAKDELEENFSRLDNLLEKIKTHTKESTADLKYGVQDTVE